MAGIYRRRSKGEIMTRLTRIFAAIGSLGMICLMGCTPQNQGAAASSQPVSYTLNTPLNIIANDPRGLEILRRDIPDIAYNPNFHWSPLNSISEIEDLSDGRLPPHELARVQAALAQLSAEEQASRTPGGFQVQQPVYTTSFVCQDGNTPVQNAVCGNPQLASLDIQLGSLFHRHMGSDSIFERDQVLASERAWALGLPGACGISAQSTGLPDPAVVSCLANAYQAQIATLANWPPPQISAADTQNNVIAKYVHYTLLDAKQPALCANLGAQAAGALSDDGSINPNQLAGVTEIAGSHGNASGTSASGNIFVDFHRAALYAGYQVRARSVTVASAATPLLGETSVGDYVQSLPNGGGRFVSFASQTGDYGDIDVFTLNGQLLALITDTIGYNSPAPPGEAAVAAVFTITPNTAAPTCLFETYLMPPPISMGTFSEQPSLTPFLALIDALHGEAPADLPASDRQDTSYLSDETRWMLFNMPQIVLAEVRRENWTGWLRYRHDQVLDALFAWSQKSPANQAMFNKMFGLLRPAATDLDTIYVQQQGLTPNDAEQMTAIAMMELLYQSTTYLSPGLGSGPADPSNYGTYQPRYPILASPQS